MYKRQAKYDRIKAGFRAGLKLVWALCVPLVALFALLMGIWAAIFALNGQSFIQYGDTLKQRCV